MKAFKFTPFRSIYILFSFLATTTASLAAGPNIITSDTPFYDEEIVVVGEAFGPYQIVTDQDGSDSPDAPFLYQVQNLPAGLSLDAFTGIITGSPTTSSTVPFYVMLKATDEDDLTGAGGILLIYVNDPVTPPAITSPLVITASAGVMRNYTIAANNNPTSFSVLGLSAMEKDAFDVASVASTGKFSFTPSGSGVGDSINLIIKATYADGSFVREILQVTIESGPITPTTPIYNSISSIGGPFDPQQTTTFDITTAVGAATGATIESVVVFWMNPPDKPDGTPRAPIMLKTLDGPAGADVYSGTINLGFDPENLEVGGGDINLEVRAYQTNAVDTTDFRPASVNFRVRPLLDVLFPDDNYERGSFSLGDIFASARISTNDFKEISARISGPGIVNLDQIFSPTPNGVFDFTTTQAIDFGGTYEVTVTLEDNSGAITEERKQLFIASTVAQPSAAIVSPNPGFTNVVFTPAIFTFEQDGGPTITRDDDGNVTRTSYTYNIEQVTKGQGYYPRNSGGLNMPYFFEGDNSGTANVSNNSTTNGRLERLGDSKTIFSLGEWSGYGSNGTGFVDDPDDPGRLSRVDIAAEFFSGGQQLDSFKILVNGNEILNGNLNPNNGPVVPPVVTYPLPGSGAILPGKYVILAQAFDVSGVVASANPVAFEILPYEPLEIALQRSVVSGASSSDPIRIGESATFLAKVEPIDEIESVKFFESLSGEELGDGSRVQIDGQEFYRCAIVFPEAGNFKVYAEGTSFNGQTANSAPVDIRVESGDFPVVSITAPLSNSDVPAGDNLEILINADDSDGQITVVEVFNGSTTNPDNSLGLANPTGFAGQYRLNFKPTVADAGVLNLIARATDDLGNSTDSDVALIGVALGAVPVIEILSPTVEGTEFFVGQPFEIRARITDASPGGSISTATLSDVEYLTLFDGAILDIDDSQSFSNEVMSQSSTPDEYVYMATINSPDVVGLVITATDNSGNVTKSAPFGFTVTSGVVPDVAINTVNSTVLGEVSVEPLLAGIEYEILTVGTTNFATLGPVLVNEDSLVTGQTYQIVTEGTDFTTAGAPSNAVGTVFIAGANASTGSTGEAIDISIGTVFTYNGTPGAGTGTVLRSSANATHSNVITVEPLLDGVQYEIVTPGDTVFTTLGAADSNVGTTFISDGTPGAGTGTVRISGAIPADLASMVTLDISASDSDGNVTQVEVLNNGISLGSANLVRVDSTVTPPLSTYRFAYQASSPGLLNFQVRATDDLGNVGVSNIAKVTVVTGVIPTAAITSPSSGASITAGRNMEILVTAEDADGSVTSVAIYANGEPLRDIQTGEILYASPTGNANEYLFSRRTSAENLGNLNLEARVTDNQGNVGFSEIVPINVVLGAVPQITILSPQPGQEFFINQPFVIRASITDADGTITSAIFARDQQLRTERQIDNNGVIRLVIIEGSRSFNGDEVMVATATADEYQFMATLDTPDLVGLQIIATDDDGNVSVSREVQFTVTNGIAPDLAITAPLGIVSVDALITAEKYEIVTVGTTNFASLGPVAVNEDSLVTGQTYQIVTEGTDFTTAGAPSNAVGTVFIAGANASTGSTGEAIDISVGTIFTSNGTAGAGTGTVGPVYERGNIVAIDIDASDSDGSISEVKVFNGSTELGTANIVSNGKYRYNYTANAVGRINLNAQARDDLGNPGISNIETITIVTGAIPTVTITSPAGATSYTAGDMITIDVDADDADGSVTSVEIFNGDVSLGTASKVSAGAVDYRFNLQTSLTDLGDLQLNARATDNSGNVSISTFVEAKVVTGAVPTVAITAPLGAVGVGTLITGEQYEILTVGTGTGATDFTALGAANSNVGTTFTYNGVTGAGDGTSRPLYTIGDIITIDVDADDADGSVTSVEIFNGDVSLGTASKVSAGAVDYRFNLQTSLTDLGDLQLNARATDNSGNVSISTFVEAKVVTGAVPVVTIDSPTDGDSINLGETLEILIEASDADPDGFITSVEVFNGALSLGFANLVAVDNTVTPAEATYRFDYPTTVADIGNLYLQARATDNQGIFGFSDVVEVYVFQGAVPAVSIDSVNSTVLGEVSVEPLTAGVEYEILTVGTGANATDFITLGATDNNVGTIFTYDLEDGAVPEGTGTVLRSSTNATHNNVIAVEPLIAGVEYEILTVGTGANTTNFTTLGATDNNVGTTFTYNGAATGTVTNTGGTVRSSAVLADLGSVVTLGITASDSDGNVTQVEVFNGTNSIGLADLVGVDTYRFDYQASSPGLLNLQVRATDDLGNIGFSNLAEVSVITGEIPMASIDSPMAGDDFKSGETLEITVTATDTDPDGFITSVEVFDNDVLLGLANPTGVADRYLLSYPTSVADLGNLNLQARAVDNQGNIGFSDLVVVDVVPGAVPAVRITSPVDGKVFSIDSLILLNFTGTDVDDRIVSVEVLSNESSVGFASLRSSTTAPVTDPVTNIVTALNYTGTYEFILTETATAGLQRLTAVATDELGNRTTSSEVNILLSSGISPVTVLNAVNSLAPAVAPAVDVVDRGSIVSLSISASDSDGNVTQVEVFNGANLIGPASLVEIDNTVNPPLSTYRFDYQASSPGLLNLQVRATDDLGNIGFSNFAKVSVITGGIPAITIDSPLSGEPNIFNHGDVIPLEITAFDPDGSISSVRVEVLSNETSSESNQPSNQASGQESSAQEALKIDSVGNDQYRYSLDTVSLTAGTKLISVSAVDNRGNVSTDVVEIRLDVVPFSVNFVTQTAIDTAPGFITTPITSPHVIEGREGEFFSVKPSFTVEIGGIDASTLASLVWHLDDGSPSVSQTLLVEAAEDGQAVAEVASSTYTQSFEFSGTGTLTVTATNSDGVAVENSLTVFVDLPEPVTDLTDFINYIYNQVQGAVPSAVGVDALINGEQYEIVTVGTTDFTELGAADSNVGTVFTSNGTAGAGTGTVRSEVIAAINAINILGGDTAANRAAFAASLFLSDQYNNPRSQTVALVYKTLTGQWPSQIQLEAGLDIISQDATVQSNQTTVSLNGSITTGGTQALSFNYSAGDDVTIRVTGDGTNGNSLNYATITVRAPDGTFVGNSDNIFFFGRNQSLSFTASQTGAYSVIVGSYYSFYSGDFVAISTSSSTESNLDTLAARALVESMEGSYNGANGFLADADTGSPLLSPAFVAQIYLNKHGVGITSRNSSMLGQCMTGVNEDMGNGYILPGYQSNVVNFVADFALDVDLATGQLASIPTDDGYPYSGTLYYGRPNNPLSSWDQARVAVQSDANSSFARRALLGIENPTQTLEPTDTVYTFTPPDEEDPVSRTLNEFMALTLEEALAEIFESVEFAAQFVGDTTSGDADGDGVSDYIDSFVTQRMLVLGIVDVTMVGANYDADGDGVSNIAEILLNADPSLVASTPVSAKTSMEVTDTAAYFVMEFVRLKPSLTRSGVSAVLECADETFTFAPVVDVESNLSLSADQSGISSDYERVEFRVDTSSIDCNFFRLSVQ